MPNETHTMTSEVTVDTRHSLAETPSETYDAILQNAIERYDDLPINETAVDELSRLAEPLGYKLNLEALRTGTLLDGAILFAELVDLLDRQQRPERTRSEPLSA
jgi:hypothetical protein